MFTTLPSSLLCRCGIAALVSHHVPYTFTLKVLSKISSVNPSKSPCGTSVVHPALFTRMSRRPNFLMVSLIKRWPCAWSLMSACTYAPSVASAAATCCPASTDETELTTTCAPSSARRIAVDSPMPLEDPVTMATLPLSSLIRPRLDASANFAVDKPHQKQRDCRKHQPLQNRHVGLDVLPLIAQRSASADERSVPHSTA